jgi:hypothetical protein
MNRLSKTLEGIIAQTTFDTTRQGRLSSLKDRLMLALIGYKGSMARILLERNIEPWRLFQIAVRLDNSVDAYNNIERLNAVEFYGGYIEQLRAKYNNKEGLITSIDAMIDIISDSHTLTSKAFNLYDVTESDIINWASK